MPGSGPARTGALAIVLLFALLLPGVSSLAGVSAARPSSMGQLLPTAADPTWSNGLLKVEFVGPGPIFTVQSISDSRVALSQILYGIAEVNLSGGVVAFAPFTGPGVAWSFLAQEAGTSVTVTMTTNLTVTHASGYWEGGDDSEEELGQLGSTNATVVFYLNSSSSATAWTVAYTLHVSGWPWSQRADSLGIQVNSSTTQTGTAFTAPANASVAELSPSATIGTFRWGAGATVLYPNGSAGLSSIESDRNQSRSGTHSFVRLDFGSVSGGYSDLRYDPWITLNPSAFKVVAWAFTPQSLEVLGGSLAIVAIFAGVAAVRKRRPARAAL